MVCNGQWLVIMKENNEIMSACNAKEMMRNMKKWGKW